MKLSLREAIQKCKGTQYNSIEDNLYFAYVYSQMSTGAKKDLKKKVETRIKK